MEVCNQQRNITKSTNDHPVRRVYANCSSGPVLYPQGQFLLPFVFHQALNQRWLWNQCIVKAAEKVGTLYSVLAYSFIYSSIFFLPFSFQFLRPSAHELDSLLTSLYHSTCCQPSLTAHCLFSLQPHRTFLYSPRHRPGSFSFTRTYAPALWLFIICKSCLEESPCFYSFSQACSTTRPSNARGTGPLELGC